MPDVYLLPGDPVASLAPTTPQILPLGQAWLSCYPGYTTTTFADGSSVTARHDDIHGVGQVRRARRLGYPSAEAMNIDHDPTHSLLAHWLGHPYSPTLYAQAHGAQDPWWWLEEHAVFAVQRLAVAWGVDLLARAQHYAGVPTDAP